MRSCSHFWADTNCGNKKGADSSHPCQRHREAPTKNTPSRARWGAARSVFCVGLQKFAVFEAARSRSYAKLFWLNNNRRLVFLTTRVCAGNLAASIHSQFGRRSGVKSLCEKHRSSVGDEVKSLNCHQKPPMITDFEPLIHADGNSPAVQSLRDERRLAVSILMWHQCSSFLSFPCLSSCLGWTCPLRSVR